MNDQKEVEIQAVVKKYFEGIFYGDSEKLMEAFHPLSFLCGDIHNKPYLKTIDAYIEGVKARKSPHELGETFRMKILHLEILGNIAIVKAHVPMLGFNYCDFLSMIKINGNWIIVNKIFAHKA